MLRSFFNISFFFYTSPPVCSYFFIRAFCFELLFIYYRIWWAFLLSSLTQKGEKSFGPVVDCTFIFIYTETHVHTSFNELARIQNVFQCYCAGDFSAMFRFFSKFFIIISSTPESSWLYVLSIPWIFHTLIHSWISSLYFHRLRTLLVCSTSGPLRHKFLSRKRAPAEKDRTKGWLCETKYMNPKYKAKVKTKTEDTHQPFHQIYSQAR